MASSLKFLVEIGATDELSDKLSKIGSKLTGFVDRVVTAGEKISALGDRMTNWGVKIGLTTALLSQGANKIHEWSDAISEPGFAMEKSMAGMRAQTGLADNELNKIRDHAVEFTNTHPGEATEQWLNSFTSLRAGFQDTAKAMDAADMTGKLSQFGIAGSAAEGLLTSMFANFGTDAKTTGDLLIATRHEFRLTGEQTQAFGTFLGRLGGTAKATNTPVADLMAIGGAASALISSGRGAQMFASMINEMGANSIKSGLDLSHGLIPAMEQMNRAMAGMSGTEKIATLKDRFGLGEEAASMLPLFDQLDRIKGAIAKAPNAGAIANKAYAESTANATDKIALFHTNINNLYDALMAPALPTVSTWLTRFTGLVQGATSATEHHATAAKVFSLGLVGIGEGAYYGIQGLSALGSAAFFAGEGFKSVGTFMSLASRALHGWDRIGAIGSSIYSLGSSLLASIPAITTFGAALLANPLTWYVAGAVALGFAAYEIYEHWGQLGGWFSSIWDGVKSIFSAVGNWLGGWGSGVGQAVLVGLTGPFGLIGYQIWKHWDSIKAACEKIAGGIEGYFVGHSPPPVGPLRNLGRVTIAETIAARIRPAPILSAVASTAGAVALAAPMMAGGGAMAAVGAAGGAGAPIIHYAPVINGSGLSEQQLLSVLEKHAYELVQMVNHERERKERTRLS